ncbi:hypothetical protein EPN42_10865 [bacterium]|nr:MAG: hypothetical protein EPN42_10865 [bacterium]
MANDDPFSQLKAVQAEDAHTRRPTPSVQTTSRERTEQVATEVPNAMTPSTRHEGVEPAKGYEEEKEPRKAAGREIQLAAYLDEELDAFVDDYTGRRIEGSRRKPSRSLVGYWMLTIAMNVLKAQGLPTMPRELLRRRR